MGWEKLINQNKIKEYFQRILQEKSIANAYCFYGEEGVGKFAFQSNLLEL